MQQVVQPEKQQVRQRIQLLDILRGVAVLGTLGTNIWIFAYLGDLNYVFTFEHSKWWADVQDLIRVSVLFLVNGKWLGLLTIMFGVGLELKYRQALRTGSPWPGAYIWTCIFLLTEGFLHYTLVMEYDILMSYGLTALIVAFLVRRGDRAMRRAMKFTGGIHGTVLLLILLLGVLSAFTGANVSLGEWNDVVSVYQEGSWLAQVQERLAHFGIMRLEALLVIPMNVFLFLLGIRMMRSGVFSPDERGRQLRRKLMILGLGLGIPLNALIFVPGGYFDLPVRYLFAPILSLGYLGLLAKLTETWEKLWLWDKLAKVGQMSLSCYILQNVVSSVIFYGWGFGLGGHANSVAVVLIWLAVSCFQIAVASLWLSLFKWGPMEYVRRLAIGFMEKRLYRA